MQRTLGDTESERDTLRKSPTRQNGAAIRALREKDGMSQTALAAKVGIRQASLSAIESGAANAYVTTLNKIARALCVPTAAVTNMTDEEPQAKDSAA